MSQQHHNSEWCLSSTRTPETSTAGSNLCHHADSHMDWRELGRRVLSEASRLATEQAARASRVSTYCVDNFVANVTKEGREGGVPSTTSDTQPATPVANTEPSETLE